MSSYAAIDPILLPWIEAKRFTLFSEWAGEPARFFYAPGNPPFDCFQVSVSEGPPHGVTVTARTIDTNDDAEFEESWTGPVGQLEEMLSTAMVTIDRWKAR